MLRKDDLEAVYRCISAGESAQILGMSGVGKSNHFNNVLDVSNIAHYFPDRESRPILVRVNFHYAVDFEPRTVYSLMLEPLEQLNQGTIDQAISQQIIEYHNQLLDVGFDLLKGQRLFRKAIRAIMQDSEQKLFFIFDQFDKMLQQAPSRLFANLRGLREEFKYRLGYIIFTRHPLDQLVPNTDEDYDEFLELFQGRTIGLKPYCKEDSTNSLKSMVERNRFELQPEQFNQIFAQSGGHGGLAKAALFALAHDSDSPIDNLSLNRQVQTECAKIWESLSSDEQLLINRLVKKNKQNNQLEETDQNVMEILKLKGVLSAGDGLFSPLFDAYVLRLKDYEHALEYDSNKKIVSIYGVEQDSLTNREVEIFEYLFKHAEEVVSAEEVAKSVWKDADPSTISTLRQNISRLRKKVHAGGKLNRFIDKAPSGSGYILHID